MIPEWNVLVQINEDIAKKILVRSRSTISRIDANGRDFQRELKYPIIGIFKMTSHENYFAIHQDNRSMNESSYRQIAKVRDINKCGAQREEGSSSPRIVSSFDKHFFF